MAILSKSDLSKMEEYYYWSENKHWIPFPEEVKQEILKIYGEEPLPYKWSEQDIHEGTRKILMEYFQN